MLLKMVPLKKSFMKEESIFNSSVNECIAIIKLYLIINVKIAIKYKRFETLITVTVTIIKKSFFMLFATNT